MTIVNELAIGKSTINSRMEINFAENKMMLPWVVLRGHCDIFVPKIVFRHLNGTIVTCDEYDKIHHSLKLGQQRG